MAMLAEQYRYVIGGDPDRDTIDLAVLDTATGGVRAHLAETADGPGYGRILAWADAHAPHERVWALEGTGSFAAGFAQTLADAGEAVVEVGAVKRTAEPRTTTLTRCAPLVQHWPVSSRPCRGPGDYAKRCG
jgi:transposase